jgi:hypothetical protein
MIRVIAARTKKGEPVPSLSSIHAVPDPAIPNHAAPRLAQPRPTSQTPPNQTSSYPTRPGLTIPYQGPQVLPLAPNYNGVAL